LGQQYDNYQQTQQTEPEQAEPKPAVPRQHWHIHNESAGGYRLAIENGDGTKVQVGELLGLRPYHSNQKCEAGVIRWMRQPADGGLEVGVQVLAPEVTPIMLRKARLGGKAGEYQPALMLPEVPTIGLPATLLTPIMLFDSGDELQLHHPKQDIRVLLTERGQQTGSFTQFRFESKQEAEKPTPLKERLSPPPEEKSGLSIDWDEL
jgi:hypothetical protein